MKPIWMPVARISTTSKNVAEPSIGYETLSPGKTAEVAHEAAHIPKRSTDISILRIIRRELPEKRNSTTRAAAATLPMSPAHTVHRRCLSIFKCLVLLRTENRELYCPNSAGLPVNRSILLAVGGWVENKLPKLMPPKNGAMMKRCAVEGLATNGKRCE